MTLLVEDEHVLLVPPPGAAAVLSAGQAKRLSLALDHAVRHTRQARQAC